MKSLLHPVTEAQLQGAAQIIGASGVTEEAIEQGVLSLLENDLAARRVIDWMPEAFALVLLPHIASINMPTTFSAKSKQGHWLTFRFEAEPLVAMSTSLATHIWGAGPRALFKNIVNRSSLLDAVNKALEAGADIRGSTVSGPALIGLPAETYLGSTNSIWRRLFG